MIQYKLKVIAPEWPKITTIFSDLQRGSTCVCFVQALCTALERMKREKSIFFFFFPSRPIMKSITYKIIICKSCFRNLTFLFFLLLKWEIECWVDKTVWDNIQPQILLTLSSEHGVSTHEYQPLEMKLISLHYIEKINIALQKFLTTLI